jgi:hypothetical protein
VPDCREKLQNNNFEDETVTNLKGTITTVGALYEKPLYRNCKNPVQFFAKLHCTVVAKIQGTVIAIQIMP